MEEPNGFLIRIFCNYQHECTTKAKLFQMAPIRISERILHEQQETVSTGSPWLTKTHLATI